MMKRIGLLASVFGLAVGNSPTAIAHRPTTRTQQNKDIATSEPSIISNPFVFSDYYTPPMINTLGYGVPPKMYGQYLQKIGKQKWTKKRRK